MKTTKGRGRRLTSKQAAINLARKAQAHLAVVRFLGTVASVTDRETTGTVTCTTPLSASAITVHVRANVDLAANDVIWIRQDPGASNLYTFDGFGKGGGTGNNASGAPIPWTQSPGVTSPPGSGLVLQAPSGQTTTVGRAGDTTNFPGNVTGTSVWPAPGECMIGKTRYATWAAAVAAASAGNLIKVGEGSHTSSGETLPDGVDALGSGIGVSILTTSTNAICLTVGNGSYLASLTIQNTYTGAASYAVSMGSTNTSEFRYVQAIATNTGAFNANAFLVTGSSKLINCEGVGTNSGASGYGYGLLGNGTGVEVYGGYFSGTGTTGGDDINTSGGGSNVITLVDVVAANGKVNTLLGSVGSILGSYRDADSNIIERYVTETTWTDFRLVDFYNASGITSHFRDNDSSYPAGWTEADAALATNTNDLYSFWFLRGSSAETSWDYRVKGSINLEGIAASSWASFMFGPVVFRDADFTADLSYYFGLYRNNAGAIDTATYARLRLYWNSGTGQWQVVGEESDGAAPHSATVTLDQNPVHQPLYFRITIQNVAAKTVRIYVGTTPVSKTHQLILAQNPSAAPTWGDLWVRIHQSRGAGVEDYLFVGALDYVGNEA